MKKINFFILFFTFLPTAIFFFLVSKSTVSAAEQMCCPAGYDTLFWSHPFGADTTNHCWKWNGFFSYEDQKKVDCNSFEANIYDSSHGGPQYCGDPVNLDLSTAIGCIPLSDTNQFLGWFLKWALGIAGGIAFLFIVFAGFQIMTSAGNPEKAQAGRELLTAAIAGLVLIVFSVFLLELIGVQILAIPGFGSP